MANPSTGGETDRSGGAQSKAARALLRAAFDTTAVLRFRRRSINRPNPKWLHPAATILADGGNPAGQRGMAMPECGS
jgi:hypothetical protein